MSETVATLPSGSSYLAGALLGGTTMSALSAGGTFLLEKKKPTPKTLARDFILGAVLLLLILQILPESTAKLIGYLTSFVALPALSSLASTPAALVAEAPSISSLVDAAGEMEVKVGVPRF